MKPISVVESRAFQKHADEYWTDDERREFIDFIAHAPEAGVVIPNSGGARKVRWSRQGRGKRGGVRVVYYFHAPDVPILLMTVYGKGVKDDLEPSELRMVRASIEAVQATIRSKQARRRRQ